MLVCDKIYNMSPESPQNPESREPVPLEDITSEALEEMVDRQQQAIDPNRVWGSGAPLVDALDNLRIAKEEDTGSIVSQEIVRAAELRVAAAHKEVFGQTENP